MKECNHCKVIKPLAEFSRNRRMSDGMQPTCKKCCSLMRRKRREALRSRTPDQVALELARKHPSGSKKCSDCLRSLTFSSFGRDFGEPCGLRPQCKECVNVRSARRINSLKGRSKEQIMMDRSRLRIDGTKRCRDCQQDVKVDQFPLNSRSSDGLDIRCRNCNTLRMRSKRAGVKSAIIASLRRLYGDECLFPGCHITGDLQIDHIIPLSKGGWDGMDNYQHLCQNHNFAKHTESTDYRPKDMSHKLSQEEVDLADKWGRVASRSLKKGRNGTSK